MLSANYISPFMDSNKAPRQWNKKLTDALVQLGLSQSHFDYSLFTKTVQGELVIVLVYVDDLLVTGSNADLILQTRNDLKLKFKSERSWRVARSQKGIVMSQRKYALELISELGLSGTKPVSTPLETNLKLTSVDYDVFITNDKEAGSKDEDTLLADPTQYQRLVGKLLYLTMTRIDIAYVVQVLSQFMHSTKQSHMNDALRVVKYTKNAPGLGLLMPSDSSGMFEAYCDSEWGGCLQTRRSFTEYLVKFGNVVVSWKSKKHETLARSSAEAEFRSMASLVAEVNLVDWFV